MALIDPSSAMTAKARAKYGRRLTQKDYSALIKSNSVTEVVLYLKSYTYYQNFLQSVSNHDVHRGAVEQILRQKLFENFMSLCRYNSSDSPVTKFIIRQREAGEIVKFITLLSIGKPEDYLFSLPLYFIEHTDINLQKLTKARNYDDFLDALESTDYRRILKDFSPNHLGRWDIAAIEDALHLYSLRELYSFIEKIKNKSKKTALTELFDRLVDYSNFSRIIRLKKYYNMKNDLIRSHLYPYGSLTGKKLDRIFSKESFADIRRELMETKIGKKIRNKNFEFEGEVASEGRFEICKHQLYFSSEPEVVLLSFYILSETELKNVINIIEGVRYSLSPSEISQMLLIF